MKNVLIIIILTAFLSCKNDKAPAVKKNLGYFEFIISDTLAFGKNLARISKYERDFSDNQNSLITVLVKNEMTDGTTRVDTFSDGSKTPFFGISSFQVGKQKIEVKIEEKMMTTNGSSGDSLILEVKDIYYTYIFDIFVEEKGYKSELNEILSKQMDIEYAE